MVISAIRVPVFAGKSREIEEPWIEKVRRSRVHQRAEHDLPPTWRVPFPFIQNRLDLLALQPVLATAQVAGNDGVVHRCGKTCTVCFRYMGKRATDKQIAFFVQEFWRHCCQSTAMEKVHEEGFENVIPVVAKHDCRAPLFAGNAIEMSASQPGAKCAVCLVGRDFIGDDGVSVLELDPVWDLHAVEEVRQYG